jgi:phage terminase large subunit
MTKIQTTLVFEELLTSDELDKRIVVAQGGSRSGKTFNILIYWIYKLLQEENKTLSIVRKTLPSLKNSVLKDLIEVLEMFGLYDPSKFHKQEGFYELGSNIINWMSVDEPQKIRGVKRDYLYCNEANELKLEDWNQLIFRTTGKIVCDLNPSELSSWVYDLEKRDDCYYFKSTWRDNPFVDKNIIKELESLKEKDENLYRIYSLGEKGIATQLVFNRYNTIETIPEGMKLLGRGIDFGYNSPTALVEIYKDNDNLYFRELLFVRNLTMPDIIHKMNSMGIERTDTIWCDSASPQNIEELRRARFNAKPVNKKSILHGIDLIRRHHIFIEKTSTNILTEFGSYRFKEDKDGNLLDAPEDDNNHTIDAIRYVLESEINKPSGKITILR